MNDARETARLCSRAEIRTDLAGPILALASVSDAVVVDWHVEHGLIAYAVADPAQSLEAPTPIDAVVQVSALPLTGAGDIDLDRLAEIPLVSSATSLQVEQGLRSQHPDSSLSVTLAPRAWRWLADDDDKRSGAEDNDDVPRAVAPAGSIPELPHGTLRRGATLVTAFERTASVRADATVGEYDGQGTLHRVSYRQLWHEALAILGTIQSAGGQPGDVVFIGVNGVLDYLRCFWALVQGGMVPVPLPAVSSHSFDGAVGQRVQEAAGLLSPRFILCPERFADLEAVAPCLDMATLRAGTDEGTVHNSDPAATAILLLTSGSTGAPKAVEQTHENLLAQAACAVDALQITGADSSFNWLPLDHVGSIHMFHVRDLVAGIDQVHCATDEIIAEPLLWLDRLQETGASITWSPNFACGLVNRSVANDPDRSWDLSRLRVAVNSGEAVTLGTAQKFSEVITGFGASREAARTAWGMSETCSAVTYSSGIYSIGGSVTAGRTVPALAMRIVLADGSLAAEGQDGELQVSGQVVTPGYRNNPAANAEAFTPDGWFRTGDVARIDQGVLTITGRLKDMIIINGIGVASQTVEEAVERVPGVASSYTAVVPVRVGDSERAVVFYVADDGAPAESLGSRIRAELVRHQGINPLRLIQVTRDDVPKTSIGKIQRSLLAKRFEAGDFGDATRAEGTVMRRVWVRDETVRGQAEDRAGTTLVIARTPDLARRLGTGPDAILACLAGHDAEICDDVHALRPDVYEDYLRLSDQLREAGVQIDRVVHAGAFGERAVEKPDGSHAHAGLRDGFLSAAHTLRAFVPADPSQLSVAVLSCGVQTVTDSDVPAYEWSPVGGLVGAASAEWPGLRYVHVDVDPVCTPELAAQLLKAELSRLGGHEEVAYRGESRYVSALAAVTPPLEPVDRANGPLAVVAGGTGGIGRHLVRQLVGQGYRSIAVLGRRDLASDDVRAMAETLGATVQYYRVDVTDEDALESAVARAEAELGELGILVDAVGIYAAGSLGEEMSDAVREMLRTAVLGAWSLGMVMSRRPSAVLVRGSSAVTMFRGSGVAAYAAANLFAESLTTSERRHGRPTSCVAWSIWSGTGVSQGSAVEPIMVRQGYTAMIPDTATSLWAGQASPDGCVYARLNAAAPAVAARLSRMAQGSQKVQVMLGEGEQVTLPTFADVLGHDLPVAVAQPGGSRGAAKPGSSPRNATERALYEIWQRVLEREDYGVEDSFFELGGSSLEGAALSALVEKQLGRRLTFTDLMEFPTIREQAGMLDKGAPSDRSGQDWQGRVLRLNGPGKPALFCAHPLFGLPYPYVPLAGLLPDRTMYAFQASGFGQGTISTSIEDMAAHYIEQMKKIQPEGPYELCGWSLGALIAFEMAQQLTCTGEQVRKLILIDQATDSIDRFLDRMPLHVQTTRLMSILLAAGRSFSPRLRGEARELLALRHPRTTARYIREWVVPMLRVAMVNRKAGMDYVLRPYPGEICLVHTGDPEFTALTDERLGWDTIAAGGVAAERISGSHLTLHEPPHVQRLADGVRRMLSR